MVYLTVPCLWDEDGLAEVHLINPEHAERLKENHAIKETVTAVPLCNSREDNAGGVTVSFDVPTGLIVKADRFNTRTEVWVGWNQAEHVDALPDLINRLTVDGLMCHPCVEEYRDRVGGLKGLARRYYDDRLGVDLPDREGLWAARRGE